MEKLTVQAARVYGEYMGSVWAVYGWCIDGVWIVYENSDNNKNEQLFQKVAGQLAALYQCKSMFISVAPRATGYLSIIHF